MKKVITIYTATRAEYHLLSSVIKRIYSDSELELDLIVSGTHLSKKYGYTVQQIEKDGYPISERIAVIEDDKEINQDQVIATTLTACSQHFESKHSDMLVVLGDRYELLGIVIAALNAKVPIAHIHGGETTEGAIDEAIRHAVTKFSYLHFPCCEVYRKRIIQLGENPNRVINAGALGVENILTHKLMTRYELQNNLNFNLSKFCLVTFHPVTLEDNTALDQVNELFKALDRFKEYSFIITGANADQGGEDINSFWDSVSQKYPDRFYTISSLGMIRYLSAMKHCEMVIGNSSSGVLEAPSFEKPTVNIGDRQKGRIRAKSIIDCCPNENDIVRAIYKAQDTNFKESLVGMEQLYGNGNTSLIIVNEIKQAINNGIDLKKKFYDVTYEV